MSSQFEWQAGDDDRWETIARVTKEDRHGLRRRMPRWLWVTLLAVLAVGATGGYTVIRRRYEVASSQIAFQIQSVIDLEARAFEQGDEDLFLAQQDETSTAWYAGPVRWLGEGLPEQPWTRHGRFFVPPAAVLPATVEDVNLRSDVAWVQVVEGDPPVRRVRFYRQTEQGWLHTTPDPAFWGEPVEHRYGDRLAFYYHQRDQPYVEPLIEQLGQAFYEVCAFDGCSEDGRFEILFYPEYPESELSFDLTLPSPWLSGIPVADDGQPAGEELPAGKELPVGQWSDLVGDAALAALERKVIAWATGGDTTRSFPRWQPMAADQWLGVSQITLEMMHLGVPLIRRVGTFRGRSVAPEGDRPTFPKV
jgi:hypothetical protein